jgi:hypothetical protein
MAAGGAVTTWRSTSKEIAEPAENGAPGEIRTPDPQIRSLVLYPAELRARIGPRLISENSEKRGFNELEGATARRAIRLDALRRGGKRKADFFPPRGRPNGVAAANRQRTPADPLTPLLRAPAA